MSNATGSLEAERRRARTPPAARDFLRSTDGWRVVSPDHGDRCGMTAHRGVLHPAEYVDQARLLPEVERRLGFTLAEIYEVFCQGRKSAGQRELRGRIEARLLEISRSGGNLSALGRVTGLNPGTLNRALARARVAGAWSN